MPQIDLIFQHHRYKNSREWENSHEVISLEQKIFMQVLPKSGPDRAEKIRRELIDQLTGVLDHIRMAAIKTKLESFHILRDLADQRIAGIQTALAVFKRFNYLTEDEYSNISREVERYRNIIKETVHMDQ
ncbi:MAG: hypothetical protein ACM3X9_00755 [Bacillota bacterium]